VLASKILLDANPLLKFTVIGDGDLMPSLMELTERLQIRHAFVFTGWVNTDLDRYLMGIDIIVNPSIRGWSETFCIANIEAMAMKRPLVTYAAGGVGEYVAQPNDLNHHELFSISKNAIIVNYPTPAAVSSAVEAFLTNETLRNSIATEGYNTVVLTVTHLLTHSPNHLLTHSRFRILQLKDK
jgi:glycosyltransferase involved in cell wall biosynthesis